MKKTQKRKQSYITHEEQRKCRKVMNAFAELYRGNDIVVLDAGRYGFVKLQYYKFPFGFSDITTFTESRKLFKDLWEEWRNLRLLSLSKGTPLAELEYKEIFRYLPNREQRKIARKRRYFEKKAGQLRERRYKENKKRSRV